jgi:hypothetical protein
MDIVLRVKRRSSEPPLDLIAINKKHKSIDSYFNNLSIHPPLLLKRLTPRISIDDPSSSSILSSSKEQSSDHHSLRRKQSRMHLAAQFRDKLVNSSEIIYYNGQPLQEIGSSEAKFVIDEYCYCEEDVGEPQGFIEVDDSEAEDEASDSEDSNRENHPWNEYPDEESEESEEDYCEDKSEEYEEYEVE